MAKRRSMRKTARASVAKLRQWEGKAKRELSLAKKKFSAGERKAKAYLRKNPQRAALIAAGIGAAIGAGITAAMRRKRRFQLRRM